MEGNKPTAENKFWAPQWMLLCAALACRLFDGDFALRIQNRQWLSAFLDIGALWLAMIIVWVVSFAIYEAMMKSDVFTNLSEKTKGVVAGLMLLVLLFGLFGLTHGIVWRRNEVVSRNDHEEALQELREEIEQDSEMIGYEKYLDGFTEGYDSGYEDGLVVGARTKTNFDDMGLILVATPDSDAFSSVGYFPDQSVMMITFRESGNTYSYTDVPRETWEEFITSVPMDDYFDENIKESYENYKAS